MMSDSQFFEVAVIGSGPSGSLTAAYLSRAKVKTILIEEGDSIEAANLPAFSLGEISKKYRNGGLTVALGHPKVAYVEGRCVGGGSEVNSGLYQRCPEGVLQEWIRTHNMQDIKNYLEPHYDALDKEFFASTDTHISGIANEFKSAAEKLNWDYKKVPQLKTERRDGKAFRLKGMSQTYIPEAVKHGCTLMSGVHVQRLQRKRGSWVIHCKNKSQRAVQIHAKTIFVCCGAIHTPTLLIKSGINKNIGQTLSLHPTIKMVAEFSHDVHQDELFPGNIQIKEFSPNLSFGSSMSRLPYSAIALLDHNEALKRAIHKPKTFAIYYAMSRGPSSGRVRVVPGISDPFVQYPLPKSNLLELYKASDQLAILLRSLDIKNLFLPRQRSALFSYHLFGTVPAGEKVSVTAANSFGKIHGTENLYVNDASLFCSAIGVNPQATIMALARRNILQFLATTSLHG